MCTLRAGVSHLRGAAEAQARWCGVGRALSAALSNGAPCPSPATPARPSVAGRLGCFQFGATGYEAAISIHTEIFELRCVFISLG